MVVCDLAGSQRLRQVALRERYAEMEDVIADLDRVAEGQSPLGPRVSSKLAPRSRVGHFAVLVGAAVGV